MSQKFTDKVAKFVEQEQAAKLDQALLNRLHDYVMADTEYFNMPPERRKTLNKFFEELHNTMESELLSGKFGASVIVDTMIVTAFECGYRLGNEESVAVRYEQKVA
jgi:hypothetical protein